MGGSGSRLSEIYIKNIPFLLIFIYTKGEKNVMENVIREEDKHE